MTGVPVVVTDISATAASNSPAGSDSIGTSLDDYLRAGFAFSRQLFDTGIIWGGTAIGTNTITFTASPIPLALKTGQGFAFLSAGANTGAVTINPNSLGATALKKNGSTALAGGELPPAGGIVLVIYDGTNFQLVAATPLAGVWAVAGGTADAITATYSPVNASLTDGLILGFRATAVNATTTPTFAPDGLTAHTVTKNGGIALSAGDIPGNLAECLVRYNLANTRWELLNPAVGTTGTWTPVLTYSTAGNLAVSYTTQAGWYVKIGRMVYVNFSIVTSSFTHTTSSGALAITGLPFTASLPATGADAVGSLSFGGITKAGYTNFTVDIAHNTTALTVNADASGQSHAGVQSADMPTGGTVILSGSVIYTAAA